MKKISVLLMACAIALSPVLLQPANSSPSETSANELSPQQTEQINKLLNDYYNNLQTTRNDLIAKGAQLNKLLNSPNPDKEQIQALGRAIGQLRGKMLVERIELQAQLQKMEISPEVLCLINPYPVPDYRSGNQDNNYNWGGSFHHRPHDHNRYRSGYGPGYTGCPMMDGYHHRGPQY